METSFSISFKLLLLATFLTLSAVPTHSTNFAVGGDGTWAIPSANNSEAYNKWASDNRFQVGDTVRFKYKKDSVMVVSEDDYNKCRSTHPIFFSNNGKTEFKFEQPGLFYFISGVDGHCERGEKLIIKVMAGPAPPEGPSSSDSSGSSTGALPSSASLPLFMFAVGNVAGLVLGFC